MDLSKDLPGLKKKQKRRDSNQDVIEFSFMAEPKTNARTDELNLGPSTTQVLQIFYLRLIIASSQDGRLEPHRPQ